MKTITFYINTFRFLLLILFLTLLVSCGSSKKTISKKTENTEKSTISTNEKTVVENKLEKDSSSVKKTENRFQYVAQT